MVDVIVLNYNDSNTTSAFVESIRNYSIVNKIVIVDNQSIDGSFNALKKLENSTIEVIQTDRNGGYGYGNNFGIKFLYNSSHSANVLICNPDVIVNEEAIQACDNFLIKHSDYAIVAPFMLNENLKREKKTAFRINSKWEYILSFSGFLRKTISPCMYKDILTTEKDVLDVGAVSGSLLVCNLNHMVQYGMYDESMFLFCEERVLGLKLKKCGLKTALLTKQEFIHAHSTTIKKTYDLKQSIKILYRSKCYVLKKYYKANSIEINFAKLLLCFSFIEQVVKNAILGRKSSNK